MNLDEALKATNAHPAATERVEILREHLRSFRRDFYGHLMCLKRVDAYERLHGELTTEAAAVKEKSELDLDTIQHSIDVTLAELKTLDPDAE